MQVYFKFILYKISGFFVFRVEKMNKWLRICDDLGVFHFSINDESVE